MKAHYVPPSILTLSVHKREHKVDFTKIKNTRMAKREAHDAATKLGVSEILVMSAIRRAANNREIEHKGEM